MKKLIVTLVCSALVIISASVILTNFNDQHLADPGGGVPKPTNIVSDTDESVSTPTTDIADDTEGGK
ncbi:hypothetical protein V1503_19185 [Bacillus sp. SCS-151]|uniref:hypothetical protein n=1 Tax=Nanhaiella sioensis TaxID=3115293 RepID=UPI00397BAADA